MARRKRAWKGTRAPHCPECGAIMQRMDSRKTTQPKLFKIRLYHCKGTPPHQLETCETVVGEITPVQREKALINTATVRRDRGKKQDDEYRD